MLGSLTQVKGVHRDRGRRNRSVRRGAYRKFSWRRASSARFRARTIRDAELLGHVAMLEK